MNKVALILLTLLGLAGCGGSTPGANQIAFEVMPNELEDCKAFNLQNSHYDYITVMRCPNSSTTTRYKSGKTTKTTIVVDGVTYIPQAASAASESEK